MKTKKWFDAIAERCLGHKPASTTAEFEKYTMFQDPADKYLEAEEMFKYC